MNRKRILGLAAIAVSGALAVAVPAGAAVQVQSESPAAGTVTLRKAANLGANGAVVTVRTVVVCPAGTTANLYASVTERVGNGIASGGGEELVACTGAPQTVRVRVAAEAGGRPFKNGTAYGTAGLSFYHPAYGWVSVDDERTITIS